MLEMQNRKTDEIFIFPSHNEGDRDAIIDIIPPEDQLWLIDGYAFESIMKEWDALPWYKKLNWKIKYFLMK